MLSNRILATNRLITTATASSVCLHVLEKPIHKPLPGKIRAQDVSSVCLQKNIHTTQFWNKYNDKKSSKNDDDSDTDDDDPEFKDERDSKVVKVKINSLRADLVLRSGLNMARNKIEVIFYESKIRVNGKKLAKKSTQLNIGDEIDIIKGFSSANPSHLVISRVIILSTSDREEGISANLRRYKTMLVDNYAGINAYKSSDELS